MANTPPPQDPKRDPDPKKKPGDSSFDELPELDPGSLDMGELPADASLEPPESLGLPEAPGSQPGAGGPESGEVAYGAMPPAADPASLGGISFGALPDIDDLPTAGLSKIQSTGDSASGMDWQPPAQPGSGDSGALAIPTAEPGSVTDSAQFAIPLDLPGSNDMIVPEAVAGSDMDINPLPPQAESQDPIAPVAPAAGWLDSDEAPIKVPLPPPTGSGDPFGAPPAAVESSDIFGAGPVEKASAASPEQSDVIAATAFGSAAPAGPGSAADRTSDVALTFDSPPGGSTAHERGANSDLPVADEVIEPAGESESLFDEPAPSLPFDSAKLAHAADLADATEQMDAPEFGNAPLGGNDASSILADLSEPGDRGVQDSSAVKLESPGVGRTLSSDHGEGTEFDLTVDEALPHELIAKADDESEPAEWRKIPDADLFEDDDRTTPEVDLGGPPQGRQRRATPLDPTLPVDQPSETPSLSSIFSDKTEDGSDVRLAAMPDAPTASDSSVEFSDHPAAEDEASASSILGRGPKPPTPAEPKPKSKHSASEFELPAAAEDPEAMDWSLTHESEVPRAATDPAQGGSSSILSRGSKGDSVDGTIPEMTLPPPSAKDKPAPPKVGKPAPAKGPKPTKSPSRGDSSDPSVEIDWLASSASAEVAPVSEAAPVGTARSRGKPVSKHDEPDAVRAPAASKKGAWIGGTLLGMVIAGGGFAGAYFGDLLPKDKPQAQNNTGKQGPGGNNTGPGNAGSPATAADAASAIRAGDPARAKQIVANLNDPSPAGKALAGEAGLFALVQEHGTTIAADNPDLAAAREHLKAVVDDEGATASAESKKTAAYAALRLGLSHEVSKDPDAAKHAKKVYEDAKAKFPEYADLFDAAIIRLGQRPNEPTSRRMEPADARQLLFAITLLQADGKTDDAEAGVFFWKAVNKAAGEKYADAVDEIKKAKAAHVKLAKAKAGVGLNPLSDPLEQIFPRCCDDLKAYWELRAAIYTNKAVADLYKEQGAKAFDALAKKAAEAMTLTANLKDATDKFNKANTDLTKANADFKKAETDAKDAKALVTTLQKDIKAAEEIKLAIEKKLDDEAKARNAAETARVASDKLLATLAKELQTAKLLPEKYDTAELLAAMKRTAERATGPNLTTLLPSSMMAVGGGGLSAAQLVDIAERLTKAEAATKTANDKLATETKRLTDSYAADLKKLSDEHTTAVSKLKDDQKVELKKAADKFADDSKKLKDGFDGKVKDLEIAVESEKKRVEAVTAQFKRDLGNAVSPSQALDLWLPLLTELRRPSDSDGALDSATKLIASAAPNSEDAGKARTVAGMALLNKGELTLAKAQFEAALANPTHKPALAAKKPWAVAADIGLASISDPLAPYRKPVEIPARDVAAAARALDAGVKAYRAERYTEALASLGDSVKADPANAVAWYYLGAARWATGKPDDAKTAFQQGALREAASSTPARSIGAAIAPIQGNARDALTASRP
jgi:hypothetical protein